jgi:hypothetical protein
MTTIFADTAEYMLANHLAATINAFWRQYGHEVNARVVSDTGFIGKGGYASVFGIQSDLRNGLPIGMSPFDAARIYQGLEVPFHG